MVRAHSHIHARLCLCHLRTCLPTYMHTYLPACIPTYLHAYILFYVLHCCARVCQVQSEEFVPAFAFANHQDIAGIPTYIHRPSHHLSSYHKICLRRLNNISPNVDTFGNIGRPWREPMHAVQVKKDLYVLFHMANAINKHPLPRPLESVGDRVCARDKISFGGTTFCGVGH